MHALALWEQAEAGDHFSGFFYKYDPLANAIVRNNPFRILFPNVTWRKMEKLIPGSSRH
jgi:hypothetical protein